MASQALSSRRRRLPRRSACRLAPATRQAETGCIGARARRPGVRPLWKREVVHVAFPEDPVSDGLLGAVETALGAAVELATHFRAALHLVHVVPALPATTDDPNYTFQVPEYEAVLHAEAQERLGAIAARLSAGGLSVSSAVGNGDAGREIVRIAGESGADVIVIATHGETGWRHAVFGSVAERVVQLASCPVLTIRQPRG